MSKKKKKAKKPERHYDILFPNISASNAHDSFGQDQVLTVDAIRKTIDAFNKSNPSFSAIPLRLTIHPRQKDWLLKFFNNWNNFKNFKTTFKVDMEAYRNVIETKYGVKLCVKENRDSDFTTLEMLVPNKLFADDESREKLADALQNIAMFILSMDDAA